MPLFPDRDTVHGLRHRGTGSATSWPSLDGAFDDACSGFAHAADRSVDPPRFDARISPDAGGFTTRDPGVSLGRTRTGWLSSACGRHVMAILLPRRRHAGRTPRKVPHCLGKWRCFDVAVIPRPKEALSVSSSSRTDRARRSDLRRTDPGGRRWPYRAGDAHGAPRARGAC